MLPASWCQVIVKGEALGLGSAAQGAPGALGMGVLVVLLPRALNSGHPVSRGWIRGTQPPTPCAGSFFAARLLL